MNKQRQKRLILVLILIFGVGTAVTLGLQALNKNLLYFFSPTQVVAGEAPITRTFRLGGLVKKGSIKREKDGLTVHFQVTDGAKVIAISYTGILPDLFKEGQGIVAAGKLQSPGHFIAEEVLAKHDENYMPPEVADALEKAHKEGKSVSQEESAQDTNITPTTDSVL